MNAQHNIVLFCIEGLAPTKERDKQKCEAIHTLHYLKDSALDALASWKAELKGNGKAGNWFSLLQLHILPKLGSLPISEIRQTEIRKPLLSSGIQKLQQQRKHLSISIFVLNMQLLLGLDIDL
ncbi:hypothetical protein O9A_00014 [Bartonella koehlerae C-29]|uniref:Uncharacterized protein n=1 Tax=Bartonella koehlerae C-29 TaxID=1134510 RepID=A0A067W955_9HYPH|nr:hypothetical protein O9A_00014 [Bartonella koehlerae C-29]